MNKLKHSRHSVRAAAAFTAATVLAVQAHAGTCTINATANQQTIDGFGFASAWCGTLTSAKNAALYDTLGFSLLRVRIDENNSWSDETSNASAAHSRGLKVMGTPWVVPTAWQSSSGGLNFSHAGDYANWLKSAASSIGIDYVSVINEPDGTGKFSATDIFNFVKNNVTAVGKPIIMPEAIGFNDAYSDPVINDSTAVTHFTYLGGHIYGGGNIIHQNALNHGKHVWMTEHYVANSQDNMANCIVIAKEITDVMNNQMSAYFFWWVNDSDTSVNLVDQSGTIHKAGYTGGQFAKWIRPGKQRCTATYNPTSNIYVTAYHGNGIVIVAVNTGTTSVNQTFTIQNATGVTSLLVNRTSSSQNMAGISAATVSNNSFTYALPGQSITTFHQF
jgi:glucuronoarabinoxylan endo-1,4-beta-xylanase